MPFLKETYQSEPSANSQGRDAGKDGEIERLVAHSEEAPAGTVKSSWVDRASSTVEEGFNAITQGAFTDRGTVRLFHFEVQTEKPSNEHSVHALEKNEVSDGAEEALALSRHHHLLNSLISLECSYIVRGKPFMFPLAALYFLHEGKVCHARLASSVVHYYPA